MKAPITIGYDFERGEVDAAETQLNETLNECGIGKQRFTITNALFDIPMSISLGLLRQVSPSVRHGLRMEIALNRHHKPKWKAETQMEIEPVETLAMGASNNGVLAMQNFTGVFDALKYCAICGVAYVIGKGVSHMIINLGTMLNLVSQRTVQNVNLKIARASRLIVRRADEGRRPLMDLIRTNAFIVEVDLQVAFYVMEVR